MANRFLIKADLSGRKQYTRMKVLLYERLLGGRSAEMALPDEIREFALRHDLTQSRKRQYESLARAIERFGEFSSFESCDSTKGRRMRVSDVSRETLELLQYFLLHEDEAVRRYPGLQSQYASSRLPQPRSMNTVCGQLKMLRTFFKWCVQTGRVDVSPFADFRIAGELYGTPVYLTLEEVEQVAAHDFSGRPGLARQRDVFVFQCNVGCRVGDLIRLKKQDVINGQIEYIPQKTRAESPRTVTVPLNATARAIVQRYSSDGREELLPFISPQKYNSAIKKILACAGITRQVTVLDTLSLQEKRVRICDIGSSHMARRTFAGNLYKKVRDPALVASLTGHKEGSRAFARYRAIDDDMKRELVDLLG